MNPQLRNRLKSRTIIPVVIQIGTFRNHGDIFILRNFPNFTKQFALTQITPVLRIMRKAFDVQFFGLKNNLADLMLLTERFRLIQFPFGKGCGLCRNRYHTLSQGFFCRI